MSLTHKEIIEIIESCKGSVKSLEIKNGSLKVEFIEPHQPLSQQPLTHNQGLMNDEIIVPTADDLNLIDETKPVVEQKDEEMLIEELNITNPSQMEDLIVLREVRNVEEEND